MEQATKTCRKCGAAKSIDEFSRASDRRDGHADWCKICARARGRARHAADPSILNARSRANYRKRNAEKIAARDRAIQAKRDATIKVCRECGNAQPLDEFYANPKMLDGHTSYCKSCLRARSLRYHDEHREEHRTQMRQRYSENRAEINARRRAERLADPEAYRTHRRIERKKSMYGLATAEFDAMLASQEGRCAICATDITGDIPYGSSRRLRAHVDHSHQTNAIRALLCSKCNLLLGTMRDNPALLRAAADYLERYTT